MPKIRLSLFFCFFALFFSGCTAQQQYAKDPLGDAPSDFSVDLTVLGTEEQMDLAKLVQPSRFVLYADGSLHWGLDEGRGTAWIPPLRRTLSREQVAGVWSYAKQLGLTDSANAKPLGNLKRMSNPPSGSVLFVLDFTGRGDRWGYLQEMNVKDASSSAINDFARKLADLAWAGDLAFDKRLIEPHRYDFGSDPYVQYRQK